MFVQFYLNAKIMGLFRIKITEMMMMMIMIMIMVVYLDRISIIVAFLHFVNSFSKGTTFTLIAWMPRGLELP